MERKQKIELLKKVAKGTPIKEALPPQSWTCYPLETKAAPDMFSRIEKFGFCEDYFSGEVISYDEFDKRKASKSLRGTFSDFREMYKGILIWGNFEEN